MIWRSFGQPLIGAVPGEEPPGREGRGAVRCRVGARLDGRERDALAGDEGELGGAAGVVVGDDLLIAPGHHVVVPPVEELGGVYHEEPWLELLGLRSEQHHRVSGLCLGGVLGGGQPLELEGVPLVVVDEHAVLRASNFGRHFVGPFACRIELCESSATRLGDSATIASPYLMDRIVGSSSRLIPSLVPASTSPLS